ncbi:MAG: DUF4249 family protein [Bacteroidota bacterium]
MRDATVEIYEGQNLVEQLTFQGPDPLPDGADTRKGFFRSASFRPASGIAYTVKVSAPGFEAVEGTDVAPSSTTFIEEFTYLGMIEEDEFSSYPQFRLNLKDNDPGENFYHVSAIATSYYWTLEGGDTTVIDSWEIRPSIKLGNSSGNDLIDNETDGFLTILSDGLIFENSSFIDENKELLIGFVGIQPSSDGNDGRYYDVRVEIRSISEAYFLYQRSLKLQDMTQSDPFAEPVFVFNNIEKGLGNFAGYSSLLSDVLRINE